MRSSAVRARARRPWRSVVQALRPSSSSDACRLFRLIDRGASVAHVELAAAAHSLIRVRKCSRPEFDADGPSLYHCLQLLVHIPRSL
jgi:hypothetical protein